MIRFVCGIVLCFLFITAAAVFLLRRRSKITARNSGDYLHRIEELGKLTGSLAHEIKNPLSTIKVNLRLAGEEIAELKGQVSEERSNQLLGRALRKISIIEKETVRVEQILNGFLRYVGKTELTLVDVDINLVIREMLDFYSPQAYSHSITIRQGLSEEALVCKMDIDMIKQSVLNLFINAQQAMADGGELILRSFSSNGFAVIEISDTGTGMAQEKLRHIFDAYYSTRSHGSGLGLPTAKKIIEAHNGSLNVTSSVGKGTSFTMRLPLKNS